MENLMKTTKLVIVICFLFCLLSLSVHAQEKEKIIKNYFSGWEKKNWNAVAAHLSDGFTFTSPAPDDHITIERFREKCWPQADYIKTFEFVKIVENGNQAFSLMHVITTDGRAIRNVELFTFEGKKIKSIEVFFGGNGQGFPTNVR